MPAKKSKKKKSPPFPSTLKIGPHVYKVEFEKEPKARNGGAAWGVTHLHEFRIVFEAAWPNIGKFLEVVLHEIHHAAINSFSNNSAILPKKDPEEAMVTILGIGWAAVLVDNPKLMRWLNWAVEASKKENKV